EIDRPGPRPDRARSPDRDRAGMLHNNGGRAREQSPAARVGGRRRSGYPGAGPTRPRARPTMADPTRRPEPSPLALARRPGPRRRPGLPRRRGRGRVRLRRPSHLPGPARRRRPARPGGRADAPRPAQRDALLTRADRIASTFQDDDQLLVLAAVALDRD